MPYRRSYRPRRTLRRRPRRMMRRRMYRPRTRLSSLKVHHFKRFFKGTPITTSAVDQFAGYSFSFDQLPNYTEFTNLFDSYRINKIVVKWIPNRTDAAAGTATELEAQFTSALDFTDATAPANMNEMYQYESFKLTRGTRAHTRVFRPSTIDYVATSAGANSGNPTWRQWISTSSPTILHYGLKVGIEANNAGAIAYVPYFTYYFSCKSVK